MKGMARLGLIGNLEMLCPSTRTATFCLVRLPLHLASGVNTGFGMGEQCVDRRHCHAGFGEGQLK